MRRTHLTALFLLLTLSACSRGGHEATVTLRIDGADASYTTTRAEIDRQTADGATSVYLLPTDPDAEKPYLGVRYFSGNPVAQLWLRAKDGDDLGVFECYVPGTLSDGRPTLGWTRDDGKARNRQETGEADCQATVTRTADAVEVTFDAQVSPRAEKGAKGEEGRRIHIEGSARVKL